MAKCLYFGYVTFSGFSYQLLTERGGYFEDEFFKTSACIFVGRDLIDFDVVFIGFYYGLVVLQI